MDKLSLTCQCGQEMVVPASALGRSGLCPGCGAQVNITGENTQAYRPRRRSLPQRSLAVRTTEAPRETASREDAWRNFAAAVDLYNTRRYAEALTLLNSLLRQFPGNEHVVAARDQCVEALQRVTLSGHSYDGRPVDDAVLSPDLVKSVVLDKLLRGSSEDVQLRAAELASRLLGILDPQAKEAAEDAEPAAALIQESTTQAAPANGHGSHNGHGPVFLEGTKIQWHSERRRFLCPLDEEARTQALSMEADLEVAAAASVEETVILEATEEALAGPEILLPERWRLERQSSPRFPKKTTF